MLGSGCGLLVAKFSSGSSGVVSRILLHLSFQVRKVHSDIIIKKRWVALPWICPSGVWTFRRGRAISAVMSRSIGHGMFLCLQIILANFQIVLH